MKKLKFMIVLALMPAALIGCGKSDAEKAKAGAKSGNQALANADSAWNEALKATKEAMQDGSVTEAEWVAIKTKLEESRANYKYALQIDDSSKDISMTNRATVEQNLSLVEKYLDVVNKALADAAKNKVDKQDIKSAA